MSSLGKIREIVEPLVLGEGFIYWGLEYRNARGQGLLRVYIDSPEGISVDDCAAVSRQLSIVLDTEDFIRHEYRLEVSSPGTSRLFFELEQYADFLGEVVKIKLNSPYEGRRNLKGVLSCVNRENREVGLVVEGEADEEHLIPFELIERGQLQPRFEKA